MFNPKFACGYEPRNIEDIFNKEMFQITISPEELALLKSVFIKAQTVTFDSNKTYMKFMNKELHNRFPKTKILYGYRMLLKATEITRNLNLERYMRLKATRSNSGIIQITTMMSGQLFGIDKTENIKNGGCPHKCIYCPLETKTDDNGNIVITQPRSYVSLEPANQRATQNMHHPVGQTFDRLNTLYNTGHLTDDLDNPAKIEFMISGGTFNFYPTNYIIWFVTMSYYALNVYHTYMITGEMREPLSLEEEQLINETSSIRMIGLTIETRPDYIDTDAIRFFRRLGVTRVQTGVQHTDDTILKKVKRDCTDAKNQEGNKALMQNGFKVDNHWMLDLYGSSPEKDRDMIEYLFVNSNYAVDQIKIYPTMVIEHSELYDMYQSGEYKPYAEQNNGEDIEELIAFFLEKVPYYMRVNRVIRDFYAEAVIGGVKNGDMRKNVEERLQQKGIILKDIRCREVKDSDFDEYDCHLFVDKYESCDGINYFISYENNARTKLYGFIRLRFNKSDKYTLPELINHALIRELHVYGVHTGVGDANGKKTQHRGIGRKLLEKAEEIAALNGYDQITVISGIGVKEYYRKFGYTDYHTYLTKNIHLPFKYNMLSFLASIAVMLIAFLVFNM